MIIFDFNGLMITTLMAQCGSNPNAEISEDLIRHMALSTILFYKKKFYHEYGEMVFAADDRNYWRKEVYPYYKVGRKKAREKSGFDWHKIFDCLNIVRDELREIFPYKMVQVPKAEADDIIATLCKWTQDNGVIVNVLDEIKQPVLILSTDKDFRQLQRYDNVKQFSPLQKKFLTVDSPDLCLKEHIIRGDSGDGIPNFLSQDDIFTIEGKKQKSVMTAKVDVWLTQNPEEFCETDEILKNYKRNEQLIDLRLIPKEIETAIVNKYLEPSIGHRSKLFNYFIKNKLKHLMEEIGEF